MDERAFLDRLRARKSAARERTTQPLPALPALGLADFAASVEANGMTFRQVAPSAVPDAVAEALRGGRVFSCWRTPLLTAVPARLAAAGLREVHYPPPPADPRPVIDAIDCSVVEADVVVAETGSLGIVPGADRGLLVALLARSVAVVTTPDRVISFLDDVAPWLAKRPVNLSLISGPSRTGDVAQKHILGAHGPAALHVLVVG